MQITHEVNCTEGPLLPKLLRFSAHLALSGFLQLLFNTADVVVVGRFAGSTALAAVSSTGALVNLIITLFMGVSVGVNVVVARYYGAGEKKEISSTVHTAVTLSLIFGLLVAMIGFFFSRTFLGWMQSPEDVIEKAALYLRIYFLGVPFSMVYNFGTAILRAIGDTRRPMLFLLFAGIINVILNLVLVIVFQMDVAGVAIATSVSQCVSSMLILICLVREKNDAIRLSPSKLRLEKDKVRRILWAGIPSGLQSSLFSLSNVLIQSSVNSFGSVVIAGNGAASNLESYIFVAMDSLQVAALTFAGQNLGANKMDRVRKTFPLCIGIVTAVGVVLGLVLAFFGSNLISIYDSNEKVISAGLTRTMMFGFTYFTCGIMNVCGGFVRGLGYSLLPTLVSLIGSCGLRILWIYTAFLAYPTLFCLYLSYPLSWIVTAVALFLADLIVFQKVAKEPLLPRRTRKAHS